MSVLSKVMVGRVCCAVFCLFLGLESNAVAQTLSLRPTTSTPNWDPGTNPSGFQIVWGAYNDYTTTDDYNAYATGNSQSCWPLGAPSTTTRSSIWSGIPAGYHSQELQIRWWYYFWSQNVHAASVIESTAKIEYSIDGTTWQLADDTPSNATRVFSAHNTSIGAAYTPIDLVVTLPAGIQSGSITVRATVKVEIIHSSAVSSERQGNYQQRSWP